MNMLSNLLFISEVETYVHVIKSIRAISGKNDVTLIITYIYKYFC